jgi:hypothetical protein
MHALKSWGRAIASGRLKCCTLKQPALMHFSNGGADDVVTNPRPSIALL